MENPVKTTEERILEAAKRVFHAKGYDGARMQEIADEAGVNKSLVHYYYRNKDNLFQAVFDYRSTQPINPSCGLGNILACKMCNGFS